MSRMRRRTWFSTWSVGNRCGGCWWEWWFDWWLSTADGVDVDVDGVGGEAARSRDETGTTVPALAVSNGGMASRAALDSVQKPLSSVMMSLGDVSMPSYF